jgi:hypothetical protein
MTQRSDLSRYTSFPGDPAQLAVRLGEFARDSNNALERRVLGRTKVVQRYAATGSTSTKIALTSLDTPPLGVTLIRAELVTDASTPVLATPTLGFTFANNTINVFEPSGLTANTVYNLTFLIVEM